MLQTSGDLAHYLSHMRDYCHNRAQGMECDPAHNSEYAIEWWHDSGRFYSDAYDELVDYQFNNSAAFVRHLMNLNRMHVQETPGYLASMKT